MGAPATAARCAALQFELLIVLPEASARRDRHANAGCLHELQKTATTDGPEQLQLTLLVPALLSACQRRPLAPSSCSSHFWCFWIKNGFAIGVPATAASCAAKQQLTLLVALQKSPARRDQHDGVAASYLAGAGCAEQLIVKKKRFSKRRTA